MLLTKLTLQNIRSYSSQTIEFSQGATLLAGDIGAGKSSILLAIEFALFGTSRPDLPGDHLLRKGTSQGYVELEFKLNDIEYIINRTLKKDKHGVRQTTGFLVTNGIKKELTAQELKSAIIEILGYPQDVISKNKNHIFHYTIYTPQEAMKFILQDNPDIRLNVLRKIFSVDKYKIIRDNSAMYLKDLRLRMARLEGEITPLESLKVECENLQKNKEEVQKAIATKKPLAEKIEQTYTQIKERVETITKQQEERNNILASIQTLQARIEEKEQVNAKLALQQAQLQKQLEQSEQSTHPLEVIQEKINTLEIKKETLIRNISSLQEKIRSLQSHLTTLQQTQTQEQEQLENLTVKKEELVALENTIATLKQSQDSKEQLQELLSKTNSIITRNTTLLEQSNRLQEQIMGLENCPTCRQDVTNEHKEQIRTQEQEKITKAQNLLFEARKKGQQISDQLNRVEQDHKTLLEATNRKTRVELEIMHAATLEQKISDRKEQIKGIVQENNSLMNQLQEAQQQEKEESLTSQIKELRWKLQKQEEKNKIEQQEKHVSSELEVGKKQLQELRDNVAQKEKECTRLTDNKEQLQKLKQEFEVENAKMQEVKIELAKLQTTKQGIETQEQGLLFKIKELTTKKNELIKKKEIHFWFEEHFIKLTYAIEKQVMIRIHSLFNELFQEWFSILLDDENLYARIDDSFSPILEQNGYEVGYSNLSGGEKTSVALAYRLALNRVINDVIHEIKTKDLLILDEPTDGFSSEQLDKVRDVLERLNLAQTIIVSHENKIESFVQNVIRVTKRGHVSEVS